MARALLVIVVLVGFAGGTALSYIWLSPERTADLLDPKHPPEQLVVKRGIVSSIDKVASTFVLNIPDPYGTGGTTSLLVSYDADTRIALATDDTGASGRDLQELLGHSARARILIKSVIYATSVRGDGVQ